VVAVDGQASPAAVHRLTRAFRTLSSGNEAMLHAGGEEALLVTMCRVIVEEGGYRLAWVGYAVHDAHKRIRPMAQAGFTGGSLEEAAQMSWDESARGQGPTGRAIRTGEIQIVRDVRTDPHFEPWREEALRRGYASNISLPLTTEEGAVFGALTICASESDAFDEAEVGLLAELAEELSFGIAALRTRAERDRAEDAWRESARQLHHSLEETVGAIAAAVEMRDPYTAGHQRRVATLAVAIGGRLHLSEEHLLGLRLASEVHDVGKIRVPVEILTRPSDLTTLEVEILHTHAEAGYEILKGIEFPWPVAETVRQHHERLDGSGYPRGLRGDAILPEARIVAVADVVEAMASLRPYRASLGIEAAVAEVRGHRGSWFDPEVVDGCCAALEEGEWAP